MASKPTSFPASVSLSSITLTNVSKTFARGTRAVRDFTLEVADGEFCVIVGPSGSGKSTVLRMIAGLESPTSGEIAIDGASTRGVAPHERGVAMVFQESALYPHLSVRANLEHAIKKQALSTAETRERLEETATLLGLQPLLDRRPHELSGGEAQRVALGRALARRPRVFLLDEPLTNLDAALQSRLRREIAAQQKRLQATMLCVTHDQAEAMTLAERLVVMRDGAIEQVGAPHEVYRRPANTFVAQFLGEPSMNLFAGEACGARFSLDSDTEWPAAGIGNGAVTLGVRAEDLAPTSGGAPRFATALVVGMERLGHEKLVHATLAGQPCVVRLPSDSPPIDSTLPLSIRRGAEHWFDRDGRRLR